MLKMRLQLGVILLVTFAVLDFLWAGSLDLGEKITLTVPVSVLMLSALILMLATMYKAREEEDGAICFAPDHPLVKASIIPESGQDKLCPVYWKLSGLGILAAGVLAGLGLMLAALIMPFYGFWWGLVALVGLTGLIVGEALSEEPEWTWEHRVGTILLPSILGGALVSFLGFLILIGELVHLLLGVLVLAAIVGVAILAGKFLDRNVDAVAAKLGVAGTAIGGSYLVQKIFKPTKEQLCVKLRKCDLAQ